MSRMPGWTTCLQFLVVLTIVGFGLSIISAYRGVISVLIIISLAVAVWCRRSRSQ